MALLTPEVTGIGYFPYRVNRKTDTAHTDGAGSGRQCLAALHQPVGKLLPAHKIAKEQSTGCLP